MGKIFKFSLFVLTAAACFIGYHFYHSTSFQNISSKLANLMQKSNKCFPTICHHGLNIIVISAGNNDIINNGQYQGNRKLGANTLYVEGLSSSLFEEFNCYISKIAKMVVFDGIKQLIVERSEFSSGDFARFLNSTGLKEVKPEIYYCKIDENHDKFLEQLNSRIKKWTIEGTEFNDCTIQKITDVDYDAFIGNTLQSKPGDQFLQGTVVPKPVADSELRDTNDTSVSDECTDDSDSLNEQHDCTLTVRPKKI